MAPLVALIDSPSARPAALQVSTATEELSVADGVTVVTAEPVTVFWVEMAATDTELEIVQANVAEPVNAELSVAVTVTELAHAVVGVPVMAPVVALMDSPTGRPTALQVSVATELVSVPVVGSVAIADPDIFDCAAMAATVTLLAIVQAKLVEPEKPDPSVAVSVAE